MHEFQSQLGKYIQEFLEYRCVQGYNEKSYIGTLRNIDKFYVEYYPEENTLTQQIVHEWLGINSGCSLSHMVRKASIARMLGKYIMNQGMNAYILPDKFISNRRKNSAYIFSDSELSRLFKEIDQIYIKGNPFASCQMPVLFRLIYTCGLRPREGRILEWHNINVNTGEILITHTKRNKERIVVMSDEMLSLYKQYNNHRQNVYPDSIYAFPNPNGDAYSNECLRKHFNLCWKKANPNISSDKLQRVRVYDLRHRFASATLNRWLDEKRNLGVMLPYLQAYMGHDVLSSTAKYIHLLPENLVKSSGIDWESMQSLIPEVMS